MISAIWIFLNWRFTPNEIGQGFTVLTPDYQAVVRLDITKRNSEKEE